MKVFLPFLFIFLSFSNALAQSNEYLKNSPRLIQNKTSNGVLYQIGVYKVQGNPYLFKDYSAGDFYSAPETAKNIQLNYNVYNKEVEFISTSNKDQALVKMPGDLDSFTLRRSDKKKQQEEFRFIYGKHIGVLEELYYQVLHKGPKYSLYKKYKCELVMPSSNYGQSDLREFQITGEYWYINESTKEIKKINSTAGALKKEMGDIKDLSEVMKGSGMFKNLDATFIKVFVYLNE